MYLATLKYSIYDVVCIFPSTTILRIDKEDEIGKPEKHK